MIVLHTKDNSWIVQGQGTHRPPKLDIGYVSKTLWISVHDFYISDFIGELNIWF